MLSSSAFTLFAVVFGLLGAIVFLLSPATTRARFSSMFIATFWQEQALRGLALGRRRRDRPLPHGARALHLWLWHLQAVYLRDRGAKALQAKSRECMLGKLKDKPSKIIFMATIAGLWFVLRENFTALLEIIYLAIQIWRFMRNCEHRGLLRAYILGSLLKFHFKFYRRVTRE